MKKGQFLYLLKKGQRQFKGIDLEGSFINEELKDLAFENCFINADFSGAYLTNTRFENCNLKTSIFDYSNINQTEFRGNILDGAEFNFVKYNDVMLINNSYYASKFTREVLEEMRYPNHIGFHIINVHAGWFGIDLIDKMNLITVTASDYLGNDAPKDLLEVLCSICECFSGDNVAKWLCWDEEPGAYIWKFVRDKKKIKISVYTSECKSYNIDETNRKSFEGEKFFSTDIETEGELLGFVYEVIRSFERIRDSMGIPGYEKEWGSFPEEELSMLKKLIAEVKHAEN